MDRETELTLEPPEDESFRLKVLPTSTISEIKRMIQENRDIPVREQTLYLHGRALPDEVTVRSILTLEDFTILIITPGYFPPLPSPPPRNMIHTLLKIQNYPLTDLFIEQRVKISQIKQTIHEIHGVPVENLKLTFGQLVLGADNAVLGDFVSADVACIEGSLGNLPPPPPPASAASGSRNLQGNRAKRMRVRVVSHDGNHQVAVDTENDFVEGLRKLIEVCKPFALPENGYFFSHRGFPMADEQSFEFYGVRDGDTIQICPNK